VSVCTCTSARAWGCAAEKPLRGLCGRRGGSERNRSRLTAGLARAMTPHPRDAPLGGGRASMAFYCDEGR
jgi:hypothetical protein